MPALKVYIDTSVLGAIHDVEDLPRVEVTKQLLNVLKAGGEFTPFISNIVIEEIEKAPLVRYCATASESAQAQCYPSGEN